MESPFFSIIIPLYNKEHFVKATINSALKQSFENYEIIVVNDGSTDNSKDVVKSIKDDRIKLYNIKNSGVSNARNYGVKMTKSNYIVFLDADDTWKINHLENLKKLLDRFPNCGLYACAYNKQISNLFLKSIYPKIPTEKGWMGIVTNYFESSTIDALAWTSAVMMPKDTFNKLGGFDENITLGAGEDTDLWIKTALNYPIAFSNTTTATHVQHADNRLSNTNTNKRNFIDLDQYEEVAQKNRSLKKYLDLNRFSIGIKFKLIGDKKRANDYFEKIDIKNLNFKQKLLMKANRNIIKKTIKYQSMIRKIGINITSQS